MTAVYLVRHTETTWNRAQRYQGRLEAPLSETGRAQAAKLSSAFGPGDLEVVYSSPLRRALVLGRDLAERTHAPLCTDQRLTEIAMGPWEGLYLSQIRSSYPELYEAWYTRPDTVTFPLGESVGAVQSRALSFLEGVFHAHPTGHVAVVTHSVVVQVLVASSLALDLRNLHRLRVSNGGISILCGTELPGATLQFNSTDALYGSPVASATALDCVSWRRRRMTQ